MLGEQTPDGWTASFRPRGVARFFPAAFLLVWLCGWAAGESFAIAILYQGARSLLTGRPPAPGWGPVELGPALAVGAFLLFWLVFWTIGGIAAMRELLRLTWSEDRVIARPDRLTLVRRTGPFRRTTHVPRESVRRVYRQRPGGPVLVETPSGSLELTGLGSAEERDELEAGVRRELDLDRGPSRDAAQETLPEGWEEILDPGGGAALVRSLAARRKQAVVAWCVAAALGAAAAALLGRLSERPDWGALAAMATAGAVLTGWLASRLTWARLEWRVETGRLTLRRRFGSRAKDEFVAALLELTRSDDGDGDAWYELSALARELPADAPPDRRSIRNVVRVPREPDVPRRLGRWIAARTGLPFRDLATEEARAADIAQLVAALEQTGRIGRWIARRLPQKPS